MPLTGVLVVRIAILLVLALFTAPLFAGCLTSPLPSAVAEGPEVRAMAADWYEAVLPRLNGHNHRDPTQHEGRSTPNFELLGHSDLYTRDSRNRVTGEWACGNAADRPDGRRLAVVGAIGREPVAIVDVTDPQAPFKVGAFVVSGVSSYDAALTMDGLHLAIAFNSLARAPPVRVGADASTGMSLAFEDACTGETRDVAFPDLAAHSGVMLIDLTDPSQPRYQDYWPTPAFNVHGVGTADVDGHQYVVASIVNLVHSASYFTFLEAIDTPLGGKLVHLSTFAPPPVALDQGTRPFVPSFNGHNDAAIQKHPLNGKTYAYLAAWDGGLITLDFTVPAAPVLVANWAPPSTGVVSSSLTDSGCYVGAVHEAFPMPEAKDGQHVLVLGQECPFQGAHRAAGNLFFLDNTDPAAPALLGKWNLPVDTAPWTVDYQASPHYMTVVDDTLFVSMYHAGVWAIDLSAGYTAPHAIGAYLPDRPAPAGAPVGLAPETLQVQALSSGDLVVFDMRSGAYTLRFDASNPAPAAAPWFS